MTRPPINELLGLDTPTLLVHPDGSVEHVDNEYPPESGSYGSEYVDVVTEGINGWKAWSGLSNQHGYDGPVFHTSETISESMAERIFATPGYYAVESVEAGDEDPDLDDFTPVGWVLLHKPA